MGRTASIAQYLPLLDRQRLTDIEAQEANAEHAALMALMNATHFNQLLPDTQATLLALFAAGVQHLDALADSDEFAALGSERQRQAMDVYAVPGVDHNMVLWSLSQPELLEPLVALATEPMHKDFALYDMPRWSILNSALAEVLDPNTIRQGHFGTCVVTSALWMLAKERPQEYLRLIAGLVSPSGKAVMANGLPLQRFPGSIALPGDDRSVTGRLLQTALMAYGNGTDSYSLISDLSFSDKSRKGRKGLLLEESRGVLEALFNRPYAHVGISLSGKRPVLTQVHVHRDGVEGNHAIVVTSVKNGRVYFHNPWPPGEIAVGTKVSGVDEEWIWEGDGIESMSVDSFKLSFRDGLIASSGA